MSYCGTWQNVCEENPIKILIMADTNNTNEDALNEHDAAHEENTADTQRTESTSDNTQDQLAAEKDRYIRLFAEFENYKKRTTKEKMEFFQYANQEMMIAMLDVLDDFERALKEIAKNGNEADLKGVELIYQKFKNKLADKGLKPIEVQPGDKFDVDFHEAVTQIPAPTEDLKGKIVDVIETGYQLADRVIRFAKVVTGS